MIISSCGVIESNKEHKFSYKFDDAQWEKILQMLKEFFFTFEDVSLVGQQSFEKEKKKKMQKSCAWAEGYELTKETKINLVWQNLLTQTG